MASNFRIAFLGFGEFERNSLSSYFRLATNREPRYEQVQTLTDADFLVVDADDGPSVQLILATERLRETVFIGSAAPPGAVAWMRRPIDALHVMRELDGMVAAASNARAAEPSPLSPPAPEEPEPESPPVTLRPIKLPSETLFERAASALPEPERAPPPRVIVASAPMPLPPPRALLVDDSEIALRFLEAHLQPWGLVTDRAHNSDEALDLLTRHSYDLVFLDVELGDESPLDGLALCQHIKHSAAAMHANVIMVSAHHSELDRVRGALAGCDAYLGKPLDSAELVRLLKRQGLKAVHQAPKDAAPATN